MSQSAAAVVQGDVEYIIASLATEMEKLAGKRLLIVGGAGFLGYYLVQSMTHWNRSGRGDPVVITVYDNLMRGAPEWLEQLSAANAIDLVKHDIARPLPRDMPEFDYIIHGGSIASPVFYRQHPVETMDSNVNGLRNILEYAKQKMATRRPVEGVLFFSSSEIYGDPTPDAIPTPETYRGYVSCTGPRACYDESKRYGETLCVNFAQQYGVPVKVARPFNNYGPGLKITDRRVLPDFARDVLEGRDIVMRSDGSPRRTFCYAADAVMGYYKVLVRGRPGEAYNIGVEKPEISMRELADKVVALGQELFDYRGQVVTKVDADYLIDNPERRCPVITKARDELNYNPSVTIDEGLRRAMVWYSGNREAADA